MFLKLYLTCVIHFAGVSYKYTKNSTGSHSSCISSKSVRTILEELKQKSSRDSTIKNYYGTWRRFNNFLIRLDTMPDKWEHRTSLFLAYLAQKGVQSQTVKCYVSAIKKTLIHDNFEWDDSLILLNAITKGYKLKNDRVMNRIPIKCGLLELILFEVVRKYDKSQHYLKTMFLAMFALAYYGLFRVGEICQGEHVMKAKDVHSAINKEKNSNCSTFIKDTQQGEPTTKNKNNFKQN